MIRLILLPGRKGYGQICSRNTLDVMGGSRDHEDPFAMKRGSAFEHARIRFFTKIVCVKIASQILVGSYIQFKMTDKTRKKGVRSPHIRAKVMTRLQNKGKRAFFRAPEASETTSSHSPHNTAPYPPRRSDTPPTSACKSPPPRSHTGNRCQRATSPWGPT